MGMLYNFFERMVMNNFNKVIENKLTGPIGLPGPKGDRGEPGAIKLVKATYKDSDKETITFEVTLDKESLLTLFNELEFMKEWEAEKYADLH